MNCVNCGAEAGRRGNKHVKSRRFVCKRVKRELQSKRKWYGAREEFWVDVEVPSLTPSYELKDWRSADEYSDGYSSNYRDYTSEYSPESRNSSYRYDDYVAPSRSSYSDDSGSSSKSSGSDSYGSSPSWGASSSSDYSSGSGSSSSSSSSSDSGGYSSSGGYSCGSSSGSD